MRLLVVHWTLRFVAMALFGAASFPCHVRAQITLVPGARQELSEPPRWMVAADFDHDGLDDVAIAAMDGDTVSVLFSRGNGEFDLPIDLAIGGTIRGLATGDIDCDDNPDVVGVDATSGTIFILFGTEDGSFSEAVRLTADGDVSDIAIGHVALSPCAAVFATPRPTRTPVPTTPALQTPVYTVFVTPTVLPTSTPTLRTTNSLLVSSVTGVPGDHLEIAVRLVAPGASIAGVQNDLIFDPHTPIIARANGRPDCEVNPAIDKTATSILFRPVGCTPGVSCTSIRALVLSVDNTDPIADGSVLYTCHAVIPAGTPPGAYPLRIEEALASDPDGGRVAVRGGTGMINVRSGVPQTGSPARATPTPTRTPRPTSTPTPRPHSTAAVVVGSVSSGAGTRVSVPVTLTTRGAAIAAVQNDLHFDRHTPVVAGANGRPDCHVNAAIDKTATSFSFLPTGCTPSLTCTGIRALVLAVDNTDPIADGALLYTCAFMLGADAPEGIYPVSLSDVLGSSSNGDAVELASIDATIRVTRPATQLQQRGRSAPPRIAPGIGIAVVDGAARSVIILSGGTDGAFARQMVTFPGQPVRVALRDLTGDGLDELIGLSHDESSDQLMVFTNAHGDSVLSQSYAVGPGAQDLAIGDVNQDGAPDILVLNSGAQVTRNEFSVSVLLNHPASVNGESVGSGSFEVQPSVRVGCPLTLGGVAIRCAPNSVTSGDYDNDTQADFAVSFSTEPITAPVRKIGIIAAFGGHGDGSFDLSTEITVGLAARALVTLDVDGNGIPDLAVGDEESRAAWAVRSLAPPAHTTGSGCQVGRQCISGLCVDGVCCETASCPLGELCNIVGSAGHCAPPREDGTLCRAGNECVSGFCIDGFCCASGACPADEFCNTGSCQPPASNGMPCASREQCQSRNCVDNVCCSDDRCPLAGSCNVPGYQGQCSVRVPEGDACTDSTQCESGYCVIGRCSSLPTPVPTPTRPAAASSDSAAATDVASCALMPVSTSGTWPISALAAILLLCARSLISNRVGRGPEAILARDEPGEYGTPHGKPHRSWRLACRPGDACAASWRGRSLATIATPAPKSESRSTTSGTAGAPTEDPMRRWIASRMALITSVVGVGLICVASPIACQARTTCLGDCDGDLAVSVDELTTAVNIALGRTALEACARIDGNADGAVSVEEIVAAMANALTACEPLNRLCELADEVFQCAEDSDCEVTGIGCCPCFRPRAINRSQRIAAILQRRYCCIANHCPHTSCAPPQTVYAVCRANRCETTTTPPTSSEPYDVR